MSFPGTIYGEPDWAGMTWPSRRVDRFKREASEDGTTIFVTTHCMDEAERCTDVGFIQSGRLLAKGSPTTAAGAVLTFGAAAYLLRLVDEYVTLGRTIKRRSSRDSGRRYLAK